MLETYLKIAWRQIIKNKWFSFVSFFGLSLSLLAYFLINQYVSYHYSFDNFHRDKERVYRVGQIWQKDGVVESDGAMNWPAAGPAMKESIPEIEEQVRVNAYYGRSILQVGELQLHQDKTFFTEASFLDVFSYPLLEGEKSSVFHDLHDVVISKSTALKLFGTKEALYQIITLKGDRTVLNLEVKAVIDVPENSHFRPDILLNYELLGKGRAIDWEWTSDYLYIKLDKQSSVQSVINKYAEVIKPHEHFWKDEGYDVRFNFDRIDHIHTGIARDYALSPIINTNELNFLYILSWVILGVSWLNYIHLSINRLTERSREVGVRKILGSGRWSFYLQFLTEGFIHNFIAFLVAFTLFQALGIHIYNWLGVSIPQLLNNQVIINSFIVLLLGTLLTGIIPALTFNSSNLMETLKGGVNRSYKKFTFRNVMIVVQFAAAICLVILTWIVYSQIQYLKHQKSGFDISKVLVIEKPVITDSTFFNRVDRFKQELGRQADIRKVTFSSEVPGSRVKDNITSIHKPKADPSHINSNFLLWVDDDFLSTYNLELIAGRNFTKDEIKKGNCLIINERALANLGFNSAEDAIGAPMIWEGEDIKDIHIIGVIKDYRHESAQNAILPTIYVGFNVYGGFFSVNLRSANRSLVIKEINGIYQSTFEETADYFFLDDHYNHQYQSDEQLESIISYFGIIAICLSCIGLLALSSYHLNLRLKEISIRKLFGASLPELFRLLTWNFIRLILIAGVIAALLSYYLGNYWLQRFPVKIALGVWLFIIPVIFLSLIGLMAISYQTIKVALINPIHNLKEE
ncbi:hypothetical protein LVD15_22730 [Fulvivirga maritima]|uniref:ABC transporter permease n=1 Tax=Fulvivirga maritima TaxID=2904247 RepID=UPI001F398241|nr:ABC transporter permease [Fulvivirga maritima]UII26089.1 hypothetical protein LVD15_22730 [Fulvivirga maritima]